MRVRVIYQVEATVDGKDLAECKKKFERGDNFDEDFSEIVAVTDLDSYRPLTREWEDCEFEED